MKNWHPFLVITREKKVQEVSLSFLEMVTSKLPHEDIEDDVAKVTDNWREKCLQVENELQRVQSEKDSMEHHTLSQEAI